MGAKNYDRVKKTYKTALGTALCIGLVAFAAFQIFPRQITGIFGSGEELYYEFAAKYLRIYMMMVIIYSVQPMTVNYFTGIGDVKQGIIISLSRQGFFDSIAYHYANVLWTEWCFVCGTNCRCISLRTGTVSYRKEF